MNPSTPRTYPYTAYFVSSVGVLKTIALVDRVHTHCLFDEGDDEQHYDVRKLHLTKAEAIAAAAEAANKEHAKLTAQLVKLTKLQTKLTLLTVED